MDSKFGKLLINEVGYHISMESHISPSTALLFVTHGIFLNYLTHNSEVLSKYTHVIIDEVHERDLDSDFILILLKLFLFKVPKLRVILMSATIDSLSFAEYFSPQEIARVSQLKSTKDLIEKQADRFPQPKQESESEVKIEWGNFDYSDFQVKSTWKNQTAETDDLWKPENEKKESKTMTMMKTEMKELEPADMRDRIIEIGGVSTHSIKIIYLDELQDLEGLKSQPLLHLNHNSFMLTKPRVNLDVLQLAATLVEYLFDRDHHFNTDSTVGHVLVFLPGLSEINAFIDILSLLQIKSMQVIPFHSTVSDIYSGEIFSSCQNVRKVIVATNIAESSITIPDVAFVIDFCLTKEYKFNLKIQNERLELEWASKASCRQRAGRTGRVRDGMCFRLVTKQFFRDLPDFRQPEMLRSPLDKILLKIAILHLELLQKSRESIQSLICRS